MTEPIDCAISVLDLCPVRSGATAADAFADTLALARHVDELGYVRYWLAEHHGMGGIASAAPEVIIAEVAQATRRIRVGSGGVMLPNHASLRVAEAFKTLEAFHPGRIDLGLGRAPGTDTQTAAALRGSMDAVYSDTFEIQLDELEGFFGAGLPPRHPYAKVRAMPEGVARPEVWVLGSTDGGARIAAARGLPYAFAQHFSPLAADQVLALYREEFRPSAFLAAPRAIVCIAAVCAPTDDEAQELAMSPDLAFHLFRQTGESRPLPTVAEAHAMMPDPREWRHIRAARMPRFVGSPATLAAALGRLVERSRADEVMVLTMVHDQAARRRSYELLRGLFR